MQIIEKALAPEMLDAFRQTLEADLGPKVSKCDEPPADDIAKRLADREKILKVLAGDGGSAI